MGVFRKLQLGIIGPLRTISRVSGLLIAICLVGTVGYKVIGGDQHTWLDALYMTAVTLTTVGYGEVIEVSGNPAAQLFTILLLLVGVGSFLYFFSNLTAFIVEGTLDRFFWRRRMTRMISRAHDHYLVCGGGKTGEHVIAELLKTKRPFVVIERDQARIEDLYKRLDGEFPVVLGDATEDEILREAGIEHAKGLVSCISNDKDNLVVAFTARSIKPELRIVSRCSEMRETGKLRKAGADAVVTPDQIGGLRLVSELVRPTVVTFLDTMMREDTNLRIEEVVVVPGSELDQMTLGELRASEPGKLMVVAVRTTAGGWTYNPPDATELRPGMGLIFMGSPEARADVEKAAGVKRS